MTVMWGVFCEQILDFSVGGPKEIISGDEQLTGTWESVSAPCQSVLYISDLAGNTNSEYRLIADGAIIFSNVLAKKSCPDTP